MSNKAKFGLGISVALNIILIITLVFVLNNQNQSNTVKDIIAEAAPTAIPTTVTPPTETPFIATPVATIAEPTAKPTETAVLAETAVPTRSVPTAAPTISPTSTPSPQPVFTEPVYTGSDWLRYVNRFRNQANLPFLVENSNMSLGSSQHSYYMVINNSNSHNEDPQAPGFTDAGLLAGKNGNIAISGAAGLLYDWSIDYWISAAFHAVPLLDPHLKETGYGSYSDANSDFGMVATMDIRSGLHEDVIYDNYPILFPRNGGEAWITTYSLPEFPNSAAGCAGYDKPTGAPIIVIFGDGQNTPQINETRLSEGMSPIEHCAFDETNYDNPDAYWQGIGRTILDERDALVIIPRSPLQVGHEYTVYVNNRGTEIEWRFTVVPHPLKNVATE